jgi:hypothetical protein
MVHAMKQKLLLLVLGVCLALSAQAQEMKGRIYYNGNMSVSHLLSDKEGETPQEREEREKVMNEIFTMSITVEFPESHKMKMKSKIMVDQERAKQLDVSWTNRKWLQTQLMLASKRHNYTKRYWAINNVVQLEDDTTMKLSEDGESLMIDNDQMYVTLKRIK